MGGPCAGRRVLRTLRRKAAGVEDKFLGGQPEESNPAPVPDPDEEVEVQSERLAAGQNPVTTPVFVTKFDLVRCDLQNFAQFRAVESIS